MQYEMKLDSRARHDPVNGIWCRVCRGCYIGRPGYIENGGVTQRLTDQFLKKRSKTIDRVHLESNRLEKRLEKVIYAFFFFFFFFFKKKKNNWGVRGKNK